LWWRRREMHQNLIAVHLYAITGHFEFRVAELLTGPDIVAPPMPGAFHHMFLENAFTQWSACVRTRIVQRIDRSIDIKQGDRHACHFDGQAGAGFKILEFCGRDCCGQEDSRPKAA
jgi:hypothetical protein